MHKYVAITLRSLLLKPCWFFTEVVCFQLMHLGWWMSVPIGATLPCRVCLPALTKGKSLLVLFSAPLLMRKSSPLLMKLPLWQRPLSSHHCFQARSSFLFLSHLNLGHSNHPFVSKARWLTPVTFQRAERNSDGSVLRWIGPNSRPWNGNVPAALEG